jgi:hypothetical protein
MRRSSSRGLVNETCASMHQDRAGWVWRQRSAMPRHQPHPIQVVAESHGINLLICVAAVIRRISHRGKQRMTFESQTCHAVATFWGRGNNHTTLAGLVASRSKLQLHFNLFLIPSVHDLPQARSRLQSIQSFLMTRRWSWFVICMR